MSDVVDVYVRVKAGQIASGEVVYSRTVAEMIYLDMDADGEVLGIEILNVPRSGVSIDGAVSYP